MTYSVHLQLVNDRVGLIFLAFFFSFLTISTTASRFYARRLVRTNLGIDDWLALAGLAFVLGLNGIFLGGTIQGPITGHSVVVADWPVTSDLEHLAQKYKYAFHMTEKFAFGLIKLSLLFLWKRLFGKARRFVVFIWICILFTVGWSIAFIFITTFQCGLHFNWNWAPISFQLTQCISVLSLLTAYATTDLFTDFVILFIPIPLVWRLVMPTRKKLGVTAVFGVGLFTIGAGIARAYYYLVTSYDKQDNPDFIADFTLFILWSDIEANVAMFVCNMPTLAPVLGKVRDCFLLGLNAILPSNWILLPSGRTGGKHSTKDVELCHFNPELSQPGRLTDESSVWRGNFGEFTAIGCSDTSVQFRSTPGITAKTDIVTVSEPRV